MHSFIASLDFWRASPVSVSCAKRSFRIGALGASTPSHRARGLMLRRLPVGEWLFFSMPKKMLVSLHMFFVFWPIDVLFAVAKGPSSVEVVKVVRRFLPFTFVDSGSDVDVVIELPSGAAKGFKKGDVLEFQKRNS